MTKDNLRSTLTPDDDGRGFTDAVLLKASGALHRRRAALEAEQLPAWDWLARWARPWVVATLMAIALVALIPAHPWSRATASATPVVADTFDASLLPADMALAAATEATPER